MVTPHSPSESLRGPLNPGTISHSSTGFDIMHPARTCQASSFAPAGEEQIR
jgi:hypothetical protein